MIEFLQNADWDLATKYSGFAIINIFLSGFLGGSETAFLSINRILLYARLANGSLSARLLIFLVERGTQFLTGIVVLNNVTLILATLFVSYTIHFAFHVPSLWVPFWTTLLMTPFTLIFAEVLPKALARPFSDLISYKLIYLWMFIYILMLPISKILRIATIIFSKVLGFHSKMEQNVAQTEFQGLLDISLKSGALNSGEREFINNILEFRDIRAREAMTPLVQLVCVEQNRTVRYALDLMKEKALSSLPVYDIRVDNPVGRIRAKDMIMANPNEPIKKYLQDAFFVPETAYLEKILIQMQRQNIPFTFVADEYGGVVGVLRIEDIVAEIVGEVIEEGDVDFKIEPDGIIYAQGLCDIDDLFDVLQLDTAQVESKTLAGFIMEKLGRMPKKNDIVFEKPWYFEVLSLQGRSIKEVVITKNKRFKQDIK